jgi:aminoglycoside/choline kinase family phosphotransferase
MSMKELCKKLGVEESELRAAVAEGLGRIPGIEGGGFTLTALAGGASVRGYARIGLNGRTRPSMVLMILSDPDPAKGVEEVMASGVIKELPFINVHRHLARCGVPVPEIYHYDRERGRLYLEDCGDRHLRTAAESDAPEMKRKEFEKAVRELVKIQVDCSRREAPEFLGFHARFDRKLLRWELDHFTEFAIKNRFPGALSPKDEAAIGAHFEAICDELLAGPYALQHRDYHMDNLLLKGGWLKVIDFQDALMGPLAYDLACFLYDRDTSALLGPELIEHIVDYYAEQYARRSGRTLAPAEFRRNFELCVIHRMLKVVGRFHFIDQVKKRPEYLRFIPFMLPVIADYLGRGPRRRELLGTIASYLPELREFT